MFYDFTAEVLKREIVVNEYGEEEVSFSNANITLKGDLQPYSSEKLKTDYGLIEEVTNIFYCDYTNYLEDDILLKINGKSFEVKNIIRWSDHLEVTLWLVQ